MKSLLKKLRSHLGSVNGWIFILYTTLVVGVQALNDGSHSVAYAGVVSIGALILTAALGPLVLRLLSRCNASPRLEGQKLSAARKILTGGCFYLIPLAVFMMYFIACYPGGYSDDSFNQYAQAISNEYNDWHPVLHTLLAFKLPLSLTGGWVGSIVLLQSLCFVGVIGYTAQVIRKYFPTWIAAVFTAFVLLSPLVMMTSMHPWKDVGFAICALLLSAYALQTVVTKGQWLSRPVNLVCFVVVAVVATIVRHNGILFTAPLILGVALYLSTKRALALCLSVMLLFAAVKGPVYGLLDVEQPDKRQVETLGLPMAVIGAVAMESPELLDEETRTFVERLDPEDTWRENYILGDFNSVKFAPGTDLNVIEEYGTARVISMMLRCIEVAPRTSFRSLYELNGRLYSLKNASIGFVYPRVTGSHEDIRQTPNMTLLRFCKNYADNAWKYLSPVFMFLGIQHLILLAFILAKVNLRKRQDWSKLLIVLGVFCYNFGSGLLLSSWNDIFRFFFYTFPLIPVLLLILCCKHEKKDS